MSDHCVLILSIGKKLIQTDQVSWLIMINTI